MRSSSRARRGRTFHALVVLAWLGAAPLAALGLGAPSIARAQDADAGVSDDPDGRATSFQSVTGPTTEDVPGGALLIGAYAVAWILVLAYVGRLALASAKTDRDIARVEKALAAAAKRPSGGAGAEADAKKKEE